MEEVAAEVGSRWPWVTKVQLLAQRGASGKKYRQLADVPHIGLEKDGVANMLGEGEGPAVFQIGQGRRLGFIPVVCVLVSAGSCFSSVLSSSSFFYLWRFGI